MFDIEKIKKEVRQIEKEKEKEKRKEALTTLLNECLKKRVKVYLSNGEAIEGIFEKFSLYEIKVDDKIIWKQAIKFLIVQNE